VLALSAAGLTALYAYRYRNLAERGCAPDIIGVSLLTFAAGSAILVLMVGLTPGPAGLDTLNGTSVLCVPRPRRAFNGDPDNRFRGCVKAPACGGDGDNFTVHSVVRGDIRFPDSRRKIFALVHSRRYLGSGRDSHDFAPTPG